MEGVLDAIIFGDLDAKKDGKDETKHGNDSQDDDVLVAGPCKRILLLKPKLVKAVHGKSAKAHEKCDKHRR